ncbi:MAG: TonB-dependent receptor domain-containing protein [Steroidobacteraceae bacterium]
MAALLSGAPAVAQEKVTFDIPAQSAAAAIRTWAEQSGLQVFAAEEHLQGVRTNPVQGTYSPLEAARLLIAGTGLEVVDAGERTVTIRRPGSGAAAKASSDAAAVPLDLAEIDEMIVTGSRLHALTGFDTLQAATVTDSEEIERRAYTNVAQALEATPGFVPSDASPVGTTQGTHSVGQSFVNLYGLGSQRTLTLLNGRRFVSSNSAVGARSSVSPGSQVDLNVLPTGLVDRIETVSIGGAPVYGSDAIAGTVNVILKNDFEGIEANAQYSGTDEGDAEGKTFRLLMGGNFSEDRGNAVVAVEHNEQKGLLLSDRYPSFDVLIANPLDTGEGDGIPAVNAVRDYRFAFMTEGGLPFTNLAGVGLAGLVFPGVFPNGDYIFDSAGNRMQFGPNGDLIPFDLGTPVEDFFSPAENAIGLFLPQTSSGGTGLDNSRALPLLAPTKRTIVSGLAHFDVAPWARAFMEASFAHTEAEEVSELYQFVFGLPVSVDNAFLTAQARDILTANGVSEFAVGRSFKDVTDQRPGATELDLYRIVGGFDGTLGEDWTWSVSYNYGRSRNDSQLTVIDPTRLGNAVDAVVDASGNIVCASAATNPGCVPLDIFGAGNFSEAAADYVTDTGHSISINTMTVVNANVSGRLPFGIAEPVAFSVGVERRNEAASFEPDQTQKAGLLLFAPGSNAFSRVAGGFTTEEAFTELVVPLVSQEQNVPVIRSLSLEGAARYVDHSLAGGDTTWSLGGRFSPNLSGWGEGVTLRGVFTHAIRSPAITELFLGETQGRFTINDPCNSVNFDEGLNPSVRAANCAAALAAVGAPAPEAFSSTTGAFSAAGISAGNRDLENETADSWSVGFTYQPTALPKFRLAMDWSDIELEGGIQFLGIGQVLTACYDSASYPNEPACQAFGRLTAAEAAAQGGPLRRAGDIADNFRTGYINTAKIDFSALTVNAHYGFNVLGNPLNLGLTLFYADEFRVETFAGVPSDNAAGSYAFPRVRANLNLAYVWDRLDASLLARWWSSSVLDKTLTTEDLPVNNLDASTLVDATLGFRITDSVRAQLAVTNVFDKRLPFEARVATVYNLFDPIGRRYALTLSAEF